MRAGVLVGGDTGEFTAGDGPGCEYGRRGRPPCRGVGVGGESTPGVAGGGWWAPCWVLREQPGVHPGWGWASAGRVAGGGLLFRYCQA
jgi:hypothetical protein